MVILVFGASSIASAQVSTSVSTSTFSNLGTLPDSSFYFLKSWKEQIQLFFTFDMEKKAEQYLHLADVRLAEYQKMIEKGKQAIAEKTLTKYENQLTRALEKAEELKTKSNEKANNVRAKIEEVSTKHVRILQENFAKASEGAKQGLERALEASRKGIEKIQEKDKSENEESTSTSVSTTSRFNFTFKYGVGAINELNTFDKTFTKDMIMGSPIKVNLKLSENELNNIYEKINELRLFSKSPESSQANAFVTPCSSYSLKVQENTDQKELSWNNCRGKISDEFQQFSNFVVSLIESKEEYKNLPVAKGGYQ